MVDIATGEVSDREPTPEEQGKDRHRARAQGRPEGRQSSRRQYDARATRRDRYELVSESV